MKKPLDLEEFFYLENKEKTTKKLCSFINSGKNKIHLLLDFDRTLTKGRDRSGKDLTVWGVLKALLPPGAQLEYDQLYEKYRVLEIENRLSTVAAIQWWKSILNLYKENKIKLSEIKKAANQIQIRPYSKKLFEICKKKNIPIIIISAGIKNVIELFDKKAKINPTLLLSTELTFSSKGYVNGWKKSSLIHVLNKKEKGHHEIKNIKFSRPNTILLGDSLDDVSMVNGENNLKIAVYDPRKDSKNEKLKEFIEKFDLIIKGETLYPVIKILNLF